MWYLSRSGSSEGPFSETRILEMIQAEGLREAHICPVGADGWSPLSSHPAFASALAGGAGALGGVGHAPTAFQPAADAAYGPPPHAQSPGGYGALAPNQFGAQPAANYGSAPANQFGAAPASYGAPAYGAPAYGAQPGATNQGQNPSQFGQAQPQFGGQTFVATAPSQGKSKLPLILGIGGGLLALTLIGGGTAAYFLLRTPSPALAKMMPAKAQAYVELTGFKQTFLALKRVNWVDSSKYDDKKSMEEAQTGLANAFELSKDDAVKVASGIGGAAGAGWNMGGGSKGDGVFLISWDIAASAEKLLGSKRFTADGTLANGKAYKLARRELTFEQMQALPGFEKTLSKMSTSGDDKVVWFPKSKILAIGSENAVKDVASVMDGSSPSLDKSELFGKAKSQFDSGAQLVGYFDPALAKDSGKSKEFYDGYLASAGPMTFSTTAEAAGMNIKFVADLSGPEVQKQKDLLFGSGSKLEIGKTLPKETAAFLAFGTKPAKRGKEGRDALIRTLAQGSKDNGASITRDIEQAEKKLGIDMGDVLTAVGDEAVIGISVRDGYRYDPKAKPSWKDFGVVYGQKLADEATAKRIVATLKGKAAGALANITSDGDNFIAEANGDNEMVPRVEVRYVKKELVLVLGSKELADHAFAAADGKATLGDDKGYKSAVDATDGSLMLMWVDTGRVAQAFLDSDAKIKAEASKAGIPLDALLFTGDKRMTSAIGMSAKQKGDHLFIELDSMNLPMAAGMGGAISMMGLGSAMGGLGGHHHDDDDSTDHPSGTASDGPAHHDATLTLPPPTTTPASTGGALPKECEAYLSHYQRCMSKFGAAQAAKTVASIRDTYRKVPASYLVQSCVAAEAQVAKSFKGCK